MTSRFRYFVRMNPPINIGSKVGDDAQEFLDCMYKVLTSKEVTSRDSYLRTNRERLVKCGTLSGNIIGMFSRVL